MIGLIRFAIVFFLVYFLISLFSRYVLPFLARLLFNRMSSRVKMDYEKKMRERKMHEKKKREREGEITIRYKPDATKIITSDNGDYVDYEEVDDK